MSSAACPFSSRHRCALWALRAAPIARTLRQLDLRSSQRSASPRARVAYRVPTCPLPRTRDLLVVRRLRGRGSAARASLQVAVRWALLIARVVGRRPLPGIRHVLFAYADGRSFRCGSRGSRAPLRGVGASRRRLRRRCGARRGGSVTRSGIETVAERRRFAQRTVRGRSPLRRLCLSIPAASDDLTKHAGSTAPTRRSHRGYTGRYKCEAIRLDAPRFSRRSRIVDTARAGRGGRGCDLRVCSRSAMVQNVRRTERPAGRRFRGVCGRSFAYVRA